MGDGFSRSLLGKQDADRQIVQLLAQRTYSVFARRQPQSLGSVEGKIERRMMEGSVKRESSTLAISFLVHRAGSLSRSCTILVNSSCKFYWVCKAQLDGRCRKGSFSARWVKDEHWALYICFIQNPIQKLARFLKINMVKCCRKVESMSLS